MLSQISTLENPIQKEIDKQFAYGKYADTLLRKSFRHWSRSLREKLVSEDRRKIELEALQKIVTSHVNFNLIRRFYSNWRNKYIRSLRLQIHETEERSENQVFLVCLCK